MLYVQLTRVPVSVPGAVDAWQARPVEVRPDGTEVYALRAQPAEEVRDARR